MKSFITPQDLGRISHDLLDLVNSAGGFSFAGRKKVRETEFLLKKIAIANAMAGGNTIAVTGMQGAGKTTLIKTLYDLDPGLLNIGQARGETLPIMIRESASLQPGEIKSKEVVLCKDQPWRIEERDTKTLTGNSADSRKESVLYQILELPYQYICNSDTTFVLMPGMEQEDENNPFEGLLDFILSRAATAVVVINPGDLPQKTFGDFLDTHSALFSTAAPLFVLSHCDQHSEEKIDGFRRTLQTRCDACHIHLRDDQIICAGQWTDSAKTETLRQQLAASLESLFFDRSDAATGYFLNLFSELHDKLEEISESKELQEITSQFKFQDAENSAWFQQLEHSFAQAEKSVSKLLNNVFQQAQTNCIEAWESAYQNESGWQLVGRKVFGESNKTEKRLQQYVSDAIKLQADTKNQKNVSNLLLTAYKNQSNKLLVLNADSKGTPEAASKALQLLNYHKDGTDSSEALALTKDQADLMFDCIAEAASVAFLRKCINPEQRGEFQKALPAVLKSTEPSNNAKGEPLKTAAIGVMLIDALDGEANILKAADNVLGSLGLSITSASPAGIILLVVGTLLTVSASLYSSTRSLSLKDASTAKSTITSHYANSKDSLMKIYREGMAEIRRCISDYLSGYDYRVTEEINYAAFQRKAADLSLFLKAKIAELNEG